MKEFVDYLRKPAAAITPLAKWLQGFGLEGQPFTPDIALDKALVYQLDSSALGLTLANRLARILDRGVVDLIKRAQQADQSGRFQRLTPIPFTVIGDPDETIEIALPEKFITNSLDLASSLRYLDPKWPERVSVLSSPIRNLYREMDSEGTPYNLYYIPLRTALMTNQSDTKLLPLWQAMLEGITPQCLGGDYLDGFRGIVMMPVRGLDKPEPALDEIKKAIGIVSGRRSGLESHMFDVLHATWPAQQNLRALFT